MNQNHLRFPIGELEIPKSITSGMVEEWIKDISLFPERLAQLVKDLSPSDLGLTYRKGGWNIKQIVHHCADSHLNSIIRFKLALTENNPTIRPYLEAKWAELPDAQSADISQSLMLIKGLHGKWSVLLNHLSELDMTRTYVHPEHGREFTISQTIAMYAWHCNHHLAHIELALSNKK
tara:strand:+ start:1580 stop:2110 length:531 start_codon:yes stop_codon:yes gene_type:complete